MTYLEQARRRLAAVGVEIDQMWKDAGRPMTTVSVVGKTFSSQWRPLERVKGKNQPAKGKK